MNATETKIYREYKALIKRDIELSGGNPRKTDIDSLLQNYRNVLVDGFGTLYRRDKVYEDSLAFIEKCREKLIEFRLLTNTASQTATDLAHDLQNQGLPVHPHEIISSGSLLGDLSKTMNLKECFHFGKDSALPLFEEAEVNVSSKPSMPIVVLTSFFDDKNHMEAEMEKAKAILREPGALLITLNPDACAPKNDDEKIPVAGYYSRILAKNTGCKSIYIGKPFPLIFTKGVHSLVPNLGATLMIGDTVGTDIMGAANAGLSSALLLRGNTKEEEMREDFYQLGVSPTYLLEDLS
jgi:glycerol 3-phosphatase-2